MGLRVYFTSKIRVSLLLIAGAIMTIIATSSLLWATWGPETARTFSTQTIFLWLLLGCTFITILFRSLENQARSYATWSAIGITLGIALALALLQGWERTEFFEGVWLPVPSTVPVMCLGLVMLWVPFYLLVKGIGLLVKRLRYPASRSQKRRVLLLLVGFCGFWPMGVTFVVVAILLNLPNAFQGEFPISPVVPGEILISIAGIFLSVGFVIILIGLEFWRVRLFLLPSGYNRILIYDRDNQVRYDLSFPYDLFSKQEDLVPPALISVFRFFRDGFGSDFEVQEITFNNLTFIRRDITSYDADADDPHYWLVIISEEKSRFLMDVADEIARELRDHLSGKYQVISREGMDAAVRKILQFMF